MFGIFLSIVTYQIGIKLKERFKNDLFNPLLLAMFMIIGFLMLFHIPYDNYKIGADYIHFFLSPLTVALGIMLYRQRAVIKRHFVSLIIGITSGVVTSFFCILLMGKAMGLDDSLILSALPKSITTPMAISLTEILGGEAPLTIILVVITGMSGAFLAPFAVKLFPHFNAIAKGIGIGTASHAVGTSKALELGEEEGAFSSSAIALAGLITVLVIPFLAKWFGLI
jgi:predicted murein hydrolase (TIGR00659 family)